jgi:hypothetical protein
VAVRPVTVSSRGRKDRLNGCLDKGSWIKHRLRIKMEISLRNDVLKFVITGLKQRQAAALETLIIDLRDPACNLIR